MTARFALALVALLVQILVQPAQAQMGELDVQQSVLGEDVSDCPEPGEILTVRTSVAALNGNAENVRLHATLAPGGPLVPVDVGGGEIDPVTGAISWTLGDIPAGMTRVKTWTVAIICPAADGDDLEIQAAAMALGVMPDSHVWRDTVRGPLLAVAKVASWDDADHDGQLDAREAVSFAIVIENVGSCSATAVVVTDVLDVDLDIDSVTVSDGGSVADTTVIWDPDTTPVLASIAPGAWHVLNVTATAALPSSNPRPGSDSHVDNLAVAEGADLVFARCGPVLAQSEQLDIVSRRQLLVSRDVVDEDGDGLLEPGELLTTSLHVTAKDGNVDNVALVEQLQTLLAFDVIDSLDGTHEPVAHEIIWDLGTILDDETATVSWIGRVSCEASALQLLQNTATAVSVDGPAGSDLWSVTVDAPALSLTKTAEPPSIVRVGEPVTFTLTVENIGSAPADDVRVVDVLDPDVDWATLVIGGGGVSDGAWPPTVAWTPATTPALARLDPGASVSVTLTATALDSQGTTQPGADGVACNAAASIAASPDPALCDPALFPPLTVTGQLDACVATAVDTISLLRNAWISCLDDATDSYRLLFQAPDPTVNPDCCGTTCRHDVEPPQLFLGDGESALAIRRCPQVDGTVSDDNRRLILYELSIPAQTLRVERSGVDPRNVVVTW